MAIARGIVTAHSGRIWVESTGYNEETCPGSEFHVRLPIHVNAQNNMGQANVLPAAVDPQIAPLPA